MIQRYQRRGQKRYRQVTTAWDLQVFWTVEKVNHGGRVIWQEKAKDPVMLCTNLPWAEFDTATVLDGYRLRWQVELLFKETGAPAVRTAEFGKFFTDFYKHAIA